MKFVDISLTFFPNLESHYQIFLPFRPAPLNTHIFVTALQHPQMLLSGRGFLQLEAVNFVDGHSGPYKKALWPYLSGRHIPPSLMRNFRAKRTPLSLH